MNVLRRVKLGAIVVSTLQTTSLAYFCAGMTCWIVLAIAYLRMGYRTSNAATAVVKICVAIPVIVLWPLLMLALWRSERTARREHALRMKQDEPSQGSS